MSLPKAPRIASGLITACITHIRELSQLLDEPSNYPYRAPLCHEFSRFRLWTRSFKTPRANIDILDEVLEASVYLQATVILLASFSSCLLDDCLQKVGNNDTRALLEQSLSDVDKAHPCLDTAALRRVWGAPHAAIGELRECVDTLFDVLSTLDNVMEQMKEDTLEKAFWEESGASLSASVMGGHWEIYQQYIRDRFPRAVEIDIEGFAKGNAYCFDRLMGMEQGYLVSEPVGQSVHLPPLPEESATHINTSLRALEQMKDVPPAGATTFKDSGLVSSAAHSHPQAPIHASDQLPATIPANMYLAPAPSVSDFTQSTICSVSSEPGKGRLLPKVPEHSQYGTGYKCKFCGLNQRPTTQGHRWRKHVFADITPYMCIRDHCSSPRTFYNSKKGWVTHDMTCMRSPPAGYRGRTAPECPFCLRKLDRNIGRFYSHVAHHMEDIRLLALPAAYREFEVDEHRDSSESGSTDAGRSTGEDRGALGQYLAVNSRVNVVSCSDWVLKTQGGVEDRASHLGHDGERTLELETPQPMDDVPGVMGLDHDARTDSAIPESQLSEAQTEKRR
ncbi:hypothetical protein DFP73DRAFT_614619 [Morchella snyderi]|nr:hypothetical protein DFP73DRAFT_614619 [Morchella snyderi]